MNGPLSMTLHEGACSSTNSKACCLDASTYPFECLVSASSEEVSVFNYKSLVFSL